MSLAKENPRFKGASARQGDLLATKLSAPILRSMLVHRARLTDLLWAGMQHRVTLVVAPAGYGKTTLLGEWQSTLSATNWPVAWVSFDAYDNDPLRFWSYIVAALRTIQPSLQFDAGAILIGQCEEKDCTLLNPLINEIADIEGHFTLVLDDCHEIQDEQIHHSLAYFIEYLPENCHLILSGRIVPPIPLSRLRAQGQLIEVSINDLSFTLDETETFLSQVMKLNVSWEVVETLVDMTEGWIAGLQLAALSLQGQQDARHFLSHVTDTPRHIMDYLTEEVLFHQNEAIKDFLLKTSVLEELSASLCDALLGTKNSHEMLEALEQMNLFIIPLDKQRRWYRYHALFAELLRMQLEHSQPDLVPQLHLAAYHWLIENGYPEKAVTHALAAGENELAAETIESCAMRAIIRMDLATVGQWFKLLPQVQIEKRLRLVVYKALTNLMLGNIEGLEDQLNSVEDGLEELQDGEMPAVEVARLRRYVAASRAAAVCTMGDFSLGISSSQQVLENLPSEDFFFLGLVEHYTAYAYQAAGRLSEGAEAMERACQNALRHNFHKEFVISKSEKARFYRLQGRLNEASQAYRLAIDYANVHIVGDTIRICPLAGLAEVLREWNRISEADELITEPLSYLTHSPTKKLDWYYIIDVCLAVAKNRMMHEAYEEAARYIQMAQSSAGTFQFFPELYSKVNAAQVRLWLARGDLNSAVSWLNRKEPQMQERLRTTSSPVMLSAEQIAMAQIYLAIDQPEKAEQILDLLLEIIANKEPIEYLLKARIVKALAQWHRGQNDMAAHTLLQVLTLAEPEKRVRSFIDEGAPMRELLSYIHEKSNAGKLALSKKSSMYVEQLLKRAEALPSRANELSVKHPPEKKEVISPLVETLSQRELQVLSLLSRGYSSGDVARHLVISVNTSKAHIKNIYQKLDVHSRREAIEKAVALQLLAN